MKWSSLIVNKRVWNAAVLQSDSVIHIHTFFLNSFPLWFITGDSIWFPVLYIRTLLFIHSKGNSLHLPIPKSQPTPLPPPTLAATSLFPMPMSLFLSCRQVHCAIFKLHIWVISYDICLSLSKLLHRIISSCTHVDANGLISFFDGWIVFHYIFVPHLLYVNEHLSRFQVLAIANSTAMSIGLHYCF